MARIYGARRSATGPQLAAGLASGTPTTGWSVRAFATYVDDQTGQYCTGELLRGLHCIAVRGAGRRASARGAYVNGRAREVANAKGALIPDTGATVSDVVDGAIEVGVFPEDAHEFDPNDTELKTFAESAASVLIPASSFIPLVAGDIDTVGAMGSGVGFCMPVYPSYEALVGGGVWAGPAPGETVLGNHAQVITSGAQDFLEVWGSWGTAFASGGFARISRAWVIANGFDFIGLLNEGVPVL
jgi:hypothetical protein